MRARPRRVRNTVDAKTRRNPPQITAHVCAAERSAFEAYARSFGLDAAGLLALLLSREMRLGKILLLIEMDAPSPDPRNAKVTVHGRDLGLRRSVAAIAKTCDTSVSKVCAAVIRAELRDKWLDRALTTRFEST